MKKILSLGFAAMLMAGITSCSNDVPEGNGVLDKDQSFYANIQICGTDAMSRAELGDYDNQGDPEFDKGTTEENQINSIYLIFYDEDHNRVSTTQVRKNNDAGTAGEDVGGYGDVIYKGIVQIDVKHGSKKPAYVMCFVNPITSTNFEINPDFATLESLQEAVRPRIIDDNNVFAMSKSVYWGENRVTGGQNEKIVATPLIASGVGKQLFETYEEAESAPSPIDIFVERYAAKVTLQVQTKEAPKVTLDTEYTLDFTPEYWAVNAYESTTYICKSFRASTGLEMTYDELVNSLKGTSEKVWYWNSPSKHRCYWAQTPAYYASSYPRVADDILDNGAKNYALGYYSYNDMVKNAGDELTAKAKAIVGSAETTIYARENTVAGSALAAAAEDVNASPKAAIASAVIVGHYTLKKNNEPVNTDMFYVMGNATNGYTVFENTTAMRNYFVRTTVPFASDESGTEFFDYNTGEFKDGSSSFQRYFTVVHPYYASRQGLTIDSRFVTIQLTKDAINKGLYAYIDGEYQLVDESNFDEVNKQMLYTAGTVQGFEGGKVFYNIPIKHLGFYRDHNVNANKMGTESNFDWKNCQSGDFGLVRNHSYTILVENIKGLGNGIPNPNDPIVPPTDPEQYFVSARIIVLNWAVVPTQKVVL